MAKRNMPRYLVYKTLLLENKIHLPTIAEVTNPELSMVEAIRELEQVGLEPWLSHGAALGIHRDGRLIPWDSDVDVGVLLDWKDRPKPPMLNWEKCSALCAATYKGALVTFKFMYRGVLIDVVYYYRGFRDPETVTVISRFGFTHYPLELIDCELEDVEIAAGTVPMLETTEEFLIYQYGEDWRVPKEGFKGIHPTELKEGVVV